MEVGCGAGVGMEVTQQSFIWGGFACLYTIFDRIWSWEGEEQIQQVTRAGLKPTGPRVCESSAMTTQPRCLLKVVLNLARVKPNDLWIARHYTLDHWATLAQYSLCMFTEGLHINIKSARCTNLGNISLTPKILCRGSLQLTLFCTEMFWWMWFLASQNS